MAHALQARKGRQTLSFYTLPEYEEWKDNLPGGSTRGWDIKYYKVCVFWIDVHAVPLAALMTDARR